MNEILGKTDKNRWLLLATGYALFIIVIACYVNYTQPYDVRPVIYPTPGEILLWTSLYVPLVFPILAKWEVKELGFSINPILILVSLFLGAICSPFLGNVTTTWYGTFAEAFARTGEEFFFRGFVFFLLIKIFEKKRRPWIWAVVGSAIAFSLIHTQTFQPDYFAGRNINSVTYAIVERFLNLFLVSIVFALIRYWTKSILPTSLAHSLQKGGIATLPFVLLIYAVITYWAHTRKENVISGFEQGPKVTV